MDEERPPEVLAAMRADYEGQILKIADICERYGVSRRRLYDIRNREGWRLRAPRRIDKNDLTQRLLGLLEQQVTMLEEIMDKTPIDQTTVLSRLSVTMDRLIATDKQTEPSLRSAGDSKVMQDIRNKVAKRLSQLNGE